jgi:hypothetical protein
MDTIMVGRRQMIVKNNCESIYCGDDPPIEIRMSPVAQAYPQFQALAAGTRILIASAFCVMPRGRRNSSRSISPGCVVTLSNFHPAAGLLIVILVLQSWLIGQG